VAYRAFGIFGVSVYCAFEILGRHHKQILLPFIFELLPLCYKSCGTKYLSYFPNAYSVADLEGACGACAPYNSQRICYTTLIKQFNKYFFHERLTRPDMPLYFVYVKQYNSGRFIVFLTFSFVQI
jgi:hypothetical protein